MPVIAINVSKEVSDFYQGMKKGKRSFHFNNILSRHVRMWAHNKELRQMSYDEMATRNQQLVDQAKILQELVFELQDQINSRSSTSWFWRLLGR